MLSKINVKLKTTHRIKSKNVKKSWWSRLIYHLFSLSLWLIIINIELNSIDEKEKRITVIQSKFRTFFICCEICEKNTYKLVSSFNCTWNHHTFFFFILVKMGLCKCPKRLITNQFCYEHRVNVCEHCMVNSHPKVTSMNPKLYTHCR